MEGSIDTDGSLSRCSLFAVFDGHGGDLIAHMSEQRFKEKVRTCLDCEGLSQKAVETGRASFILSFSISATAYYGAVSTFINWELLME